MHVDPGSDANGKKVAQTLEIVHAKQKENKALSINHAIGKSALSCKHTRRDSKAMLLGADVQVLLDSARPQQFQGIRNYREPRYTDNKGLQRKHNCPPLPLNSVG